MATPKTVLLYHGTSTDAVESILKDGLRAGSAGIVWATESREEAQNYADNLEYPKIVPGTVVEIRAPKTAFFFEKPLSKSTKVVPGQRVARFATKTVNPEWISRSL